MAGTERGSHWTEARVQKIIDNASEMKFESVAVKTADMQRIMDTIESLRDRLNPKRKAAAKKKTRRRSKAH